VEDARAVVYDDQVFVVGTSLLYSNRPNKRDSFVAKLDMKRLSLYELESLPFRDERIIEKNWIPLVNDTERVALYSLFPPVVVPLTPSPLWQSRSITKQSYPL